MNQLIACAGKWQGTNRLQDPNTGKPEESQATAVVTPVLANRFVRIDYTWAYQGSPQEGSMLIGYQASANVATAYWVDTWHMGDQGMLCTGTPGEQGDLAVRGSYSAGEYGEWGWSIRITVQPGERLAIVMHNIEPNGREWLAAETELRPAPEVG